MSVKSTQFDGDISIGRNLSMGGQLKVQGPSVLKGNVRIEGWLDAKNLKGANKGIFTTAEKLIQAYPRPHDGWWAIVGKSLPGPIYVGEGGEWVSTGGEGGNPTLDGDLYVKAIEDLREDLQATDNELLLLSEKFISNFNSNSVESTVGLGAFRVGNTTNHDEGWGTYIWSYGNGRGFIQQGNGGQEKYYSLNLQPFGGNVGINWGNYANAQYPLDVNGVIRSTSGVISASLTTGSVISDSVQTGSLDVGGGANIHGPLRFYDENGNIYFKGGESNGIVTIDCEVLNIENPVAISSTLRIGDVLMQTERYLLGTGETLLIGGDGISVGSIQVTNAIFAENAELDILGIRTETLAVNGDVSIGGGLTVEGIFQSRQTVSAATGLIAYDGGLKVYSGGISCYGGDAVINNSVCVGDSINITSGSEGTRVKVLSVPYEIRIGNFEDYSNGLYPGISIWGDTTVNGSFNATSVSIDTTLVVSGLITSTGSILTNALTVGNGLLIVENNKVTINGMSSDALCYVNFRQGITVDKGAYFKSTITVDGQALFSHDIALDPVLEDDKYRHSKILMTEMNNGIAIPVLGFDNPTYGAPVLEIGTSNPDYSTYYTGVVIYGASNIIYGDTDFSGDVTIRGLLTLEDDLTVGGVATFNSTAHFNSNLWCHNNAEFDYPIYMSCERSERYPGIYMQEMNELEHIRVIGFVADSDGYEYIDIGEEDYVASRKYYEGIRLQGPTYIKNKLEARSNVVLGPDLIKVDSGIAKVTISGQTVRFNTGIDAKGHGIAANALSLYGDMTLYPKNPYGDVEYHSALYAYSTDNSKEHLIGLGGDPSQRLYIEIGANCDLAENIILSLPTHVYGILSASSLEAEYALSVGSGDILSVDEESFFLHVSNATIEAEVDIMGSANFANAINANKGITSSGNVHLVYHSDNSNGIHTSLTTEHADSGMAVHLIGLQDTTNSKCILSIGSKSYASANAPDAIVLVTSYETGSIELIGNVYVPQKLKLGGATFTYDAANDRVVCDKQIAMSGAEK